MIRVSAGNGLAGLTVRAACGPPIGWSHLVDLLFAGVRSSRRRAQKKLLALKDTHAIERDRKGNVTVDGVPAECLYERGTLVLRVHDEVETRTSKLFQVDGDREIASVLTGALIGEELGGPRVGSFGAVKGKIHFHGKQTIRGWRFIELEDLGPGASLEESMVSGKKLPPEVEKRAVDAAFEFIWVCLQKRIKPFDPDLYVRTDGTIRVIDTDAFERNAKLEDVAASAKELLRNPLGEDAIAAARPAFEEKLAQSFSAGEMEQIRAGFARAF